MADNKYNDIYLSIKSSEDLKWGMQSFSLGKDLGIKLLKSKWEELLKEIPSLNNYVKVGIIEVKDLVVKGN
jgi:predicted hydrocarbon binding protein